MHKPGSVLMVCLGNICRSPIAQGVFEKMSEKFKINVDSAGTANYHPGEAPDQRSISISKSNGIDISNQKARQIRENDFKNFDYIFVMDKQNFHDVKKLALIYRTNCVIQLLNEPFEIEDPYYGNDKGFQIVYDEIYQGCKRVLNNWK